MNTDKELKRAMELHRKGFIKEALIIYDSIIEHEPCHPDAWHLKGLTVFSLGESDYATDCIKKAIAFNPGCALYHKNLGFVLSESGQPETGLSEYLEAVRLDGGDHESVYRTALLFQNLGLKDKAIVYYEKALGIDPGHAETWNNLGNIAVDFVRPDDALAFYKRALSIDPSFAEAHNNLGCFYLKLGRPSEAVPCFEKAVSLMPGFHEAYGNMGNAFKKMAEWDKSMDCYEKALEIAPGSADVMYSYADALRSAGMEDSALDAFMDTVSLDMDYGHAYQQIVAILDSRCDWERCEPYRNRLKDLSLAAIARGRDCPDSPFNCLGRYPDESYARNVTRAWSLKIQDFVARLGCRFTFVNSKGTEPVITLGYLSNNVKNHPNAHLVSGLFKLHDRERFRVIIYSYGEDDGSFYRRKIEREADLFRDIRHVSYVDAARMIHEDGVDILIDLTGYTLGSVMEIPALRPAPVQVRYLGFPGSMQADFFDYIITDRIMTPPEDQVYYTEKFVYMPNCYQINDKNQPVSEMEYRRSDFGLPENAFVFCSFNTAYKIEPVMFGAWMDILKDVPESVLWLLRDNPHMERNLKSAAENHNVPGNRLVFSDKIPKDSHISRLKLADLALDTRLVSGHITTSDALFAGVPVITKRGDHFISRAPSSILTHMGFPELVTDSLAGYKDLAVRLAKERDTLEVIRERLKRNRETASLFDTARFVKNYEKGLTAMWDTWRTGRPPEMIVVAEDN